MLSIKGRHDDKRNFRSKIQPNASYFCNDCNGWHLTSNEQKRPKLHPQHHKTTDAHFKDSFKRENIERSNTQYLVIRTRLNFKVK